MTVTLENQIKVEKRVNACRLAALGGSLTREQVRSLADVLADPQALERLENLTTDKAPGWNRVAYREIVMARPSAELLVDYFRAAYAETLHRTIRLPPLGGRGRFYAWNWSYWGRAALQAFIYSKDQRLADDFFGAFRQLLEMRDDRLGLSDDIRKRVVRSWGTTFANKDGGMEGVRGNEITVAGMTILPVCEWLVYARQVGLHLPSGDNILEELFEVVAEFEEDYLVSAGDAGYYMHPAAKKPEPVNHTSMFGAAIANLCWLAADAKLKRHLDELNNFFRLSWTAEENGTVSWPYQPMPGNMNSASAEQFWKAGVTIEMPTATHLLSLGYSEQEMRAIARILSHTVWLPDGRVNALITPRKFEPAETIERGIINRLMFMCGWLPLEKFNPKIRPIVTNAVADHPEWFPHGWYRGGRAGMLGFCYLLAHPHD